jgi:hypothetical protein
MKKLIVIALLIAIAHAANAQYNTPPIPPNYASSQIYYPNQNSNYWSTGTCRQTYQNQNPYQGYNYNRGYIPASGSFYSSTGHGVRIVRTINDVLQTVGIAYIVIADINDRSTKSENTVQAIPISRSVTLNTGQVVTQHGYRINGQDYYQ